MCIRDSFIPRPLRSYAVTHFIPDRRGRWVWVSLKADRTTTAQCGRPDSPWMQLLHFSPGDVHVGLPNSANINWYICVLIRVFFNPKTYTIIVYKRPVKSVYIICFAVRMCGLTMPHRRLMRANHRCAVIIRQVRGACSRAAQSSRLCGRCAVVWSCGQLLVRLMDIKRKT